eukprot:485934-Prorocentrum_lima.AAC.1
MHARKSEYMTIVGAILWLANVTRLDLAFPASRLARHLANPGEAHFRAARRVLLYIHHTRSRALVYTPDPTAFYVLYVDSSWGVPSSVAGAIYYIHGLPFAWFSRLQRGVYLSSGEAEYYAAMLGARDGLFYRDILFDLGLGAR